MIDYDGDGIMIEEMPQGCILSDNTREEPVVLINSPKDNIILDTFLTSTFLTLYFSFIFSLVYALLGPYFLLMALLRKS